MTLKKQTISPEETKQFSKLFLDYINGESKLRSFYSYAPEIASFKQAMEDKRKEDINRQLLVKVLKEKLEESRIVVRRERENVISDIEAQEKEGKMTEDERFRAKEELQKIINEVNANLEAIFERKESEVMK